ncbi:MAG: bifunctional 4-hydroxy-3-methylbut-2-enyl diphosphate reductase/30S ribosomal protein S1, partial [Oscillospiraceae bacterium]|nr:bifunctional 4-hydroxy-3-methylbut-2-enyl diphosphate reductase/30S ribosomal protein S1 [Oscillospiraceae bacterium]
MKIIVAKTAGFCFGVRRAVKLCLKAAEDEKNCYTLGPLIHNTSVTHSLLSRGIGQIDSVEQAKPGDTVIIRSHGIAKSEHDRLKQQGANIIDATCPDVAKIHRIVSEESTQGRTVIIIGERDHPEVTAISGWCDRYHIFQTAQELENWLEQTPDVSDMPISVVFQTTSSQKNYKLCVNSIKKLCTNVKIFDTICNSTCRRQQEAIEIAGQADAMIVIGGRHSANSVRLAEICRQYCQRVFFIETADELDISEFRESDIVGITAGASTPAWIIKEVNTKMSEEIKNTIAEESEEAVESFEEMLEKSIKTLHTGEKVTGTVVAITSTEVTVDLGTKQSGFIPAAEFTDDSSAKLEDMVKVGDEIESFVMRVNDVEGTVMLSKKRLDAVKNWDELDKLRESKEAVEGTVTSVNKGGVMVLVKGIQVFVPASLTGVPKGEDLSSLLKTKVRLQITEINQARRRVIGSIRAVAAEERKARADAVWNEIEIGKTYKGIVRSMTTYGAFVDIGGVDGMIHVSEVSWLRIKQPSDVLSIGDEIEVYVIDFDKEKKKISLGYKKMEDNPWLKFTNAYSVGSVADVKIVKLMPFGAFAEIVPGVDGLIHISQIADYRINQPSEVL